MNISDWLLLIAQMITGVCVCIPLVVKVCILVKECHQAKMWKPLLDLVLILMQEAELRFADGATRKEYVMAMIQTSAEYMNCPIDLSVLSEMIDGFCNFSYIVNPPDVVQKSDNGKMSKSGESAAKAK